ncbi:MAG: hypothetical protein R2706_03240 [Acidimicrobiales bacterium]
MDDRHQTRGARLGNRGIKQPHWTGAQSAATIGHFGQSGTFCWIDRTHEAVCVVLTDRAFANWAIDAWAPFNQQVFDVVTSDNTRDRSLMSER